jgi:hypothetical protein
MQFLVVLIGVALVVKFWPLIVGLLGLVAAVHFGRRAVDRHAERVEADRRRVAGLRGRAEAQHNWMLQGDERRLYGEYSPAAV